MKIVFIHFHLKTGGVTSVIREQTTALQGAGCRPLVLSGHRPPPPLVTPWAEIPGLAYDSVRDPEIKAEEVARDIEVAIHGHWPRGPDLIHVHNPTLAKNSLLQDILAILSDRGYRLLCQIHDFAEDGRPDFYFQQPYTADCHYMVLNRRDYDLLLSCGLKPEGLHLLPNPVPPMGICPRRPPRAVAPVLYPVRAIRRKNIGEAILLSLFFKPAAPLAITLPPNSAQDIRSYQDWRSFAKRNKLNITFNAGLGSQAFEALMADCRFVLTTSITEGFGYTFLEAWTAGQVVWGRLLPGICRDFRDKGINLDHFYTRLAVPLAWLDADSLAMRWQQSLVAAASHLCLTMSKEDAAQAWTRISGRGTIDFGLLHEDFQKQAILHLLNDGDAGEELTALNGCLDRAIPWPGVQDIVDHNRRLIQACYSRENYQRSLMDIYRKAMRYQVIQQVNKTVLASAFLSPQDFSLLKWAPYDG